MEKDRTKCLNPLDAEGKRIFDASGVMQTLFAGEGGHLRGICYAIEGNTVDRASSKNGRGWCENVSPTLNTQDKHAICFQLCGDRDNPSVSISEKAYCIPANPMSDRGQAVVYGIDAISSNSWKSSNPHSGVHEMEVCKCLDTMCLNPQCNQGGGTSCIALEGNGIRPSHMENGWNEDVKMYTLNTIERHSVCYGSEDLNHKGGVYAMMEREISMMVTENKANTLTSTDYKGAQVICYEQFLHD